MLVLTRKLGEIILIGDDIAVGVTQMQSGQVKLGIGAPPEIQIVRAELTLKFLDRANEILGRDLGEMARKHFERVRALKSGIPIDRAMIDMLANKEVG